MPAAWVAAAGAVLGAVNAGSGGGGSYSSNQGSGGPQYYIPTGTGAADNSWQAALQQLMGSTGGATSQIDPALLQSFAQQMNVNPQGYATAGAQAGQQDASAAGMNQFFASLMAQQGQGAMGQEQAILNAGNDPQHALYNQRLQQTVDTSRAADSARGIGMGGVSSGNESTAVQNFNTNWDATQLSRMLQANQGANQTGQLVGADLSGAAGFAGAAPGLTLAGGAAPIQGAQQAAAYGGNVAANYGSQQSAANSPWASIMSQIIPYLNYGSGATQVAGGAFGQQQQFGANQTAAGTQAMFTGLNGLATQANTPGSWLNGLFSGGGGGGGGAVDTGGYSFSPSNTDYSYLGSGSSY